MKKIIALLMGILLIVSTALAEESLVSIQAMTDLGDIQDKLDQGITIEKAYYTDGYGFSTSEFFTDDPDEISQLWETINEIMVGKKVNESVTDWYPQIIFYLSDGTQGGVRFEGNWLCIGGMENYEVSNAEEFRSLTASLVRKYTDMEEDVPNGGNDVLDGGWSVASDPTITDEVRALFDKGMEGLVGVNYTPVAYLGMQVVAGYNHAILCQATAVYPGSQPYWAIVYLFEDLEGGITVTDIADLSW